MYRNRPMGRKRQWKLFDEGDTQHEKTGACKRLKEMKGSQEENISDVGVANLNWPQIHQ